MHGPYLVRFWNIPDTRVEAKCHLCSVWSTFEWTNEKAIAAIQKHIDTTHHNPHRPFTTGTGPRTSQGAVNPLHDRE